MKTPDEIKRGLENCCTSLPCRDDCPYHALCWQYHDVRAVDRDALAYIQQLERERDALMHDLRVSNWHGDCQHCKHVKKAENDQMCVNPVTLRLNCDKCVVDCKCRMCRNGGNWEWRGVEEDKDEE